VAGLRFLPWVRDGVVRALANEDPLRGDLPAQRGEVGLVVELTAAGGGTDAPESVTAHADAVVLGPGDVTALDQRQVIRCFPAAGTENAESSLFASIDFDAPELPWQFTPARPEPTSGALRPWLVLVVLPEDTPGLEFTTLPDALPRLVAPVAELPDLAESWAWAHAQLLLENDGEDPAKVLTEHPERTLSRLICPRRLLPGRRYLAAVVPAFDAGCRAGLGQPTQQEGALTPAWGNGPAEVTLPVLHHWRFATGPDGDFETLVRRLRGRVLPTDVGLHRVDLNGAGSGLPDAAPGQDGVSVLGFEGALASPALVRTPWAAQQRVPWQTVLEGLLSHHQEWLTPPVYGGTHAGEVRLPAAGTPPQWLRELNLDPRYRAAAALGTEVVQRNQEELAAAAWQRAAELIDINRELAQGQLGRDASAALYGKRIDPAQPGRAFTDAELLALTRPVRDADPAPGSELDGNEGVDAATTTAMRRLTRARGPLARRLDAPPNADPLLWLAEGNSAVPEAKLPAGGADFGVISKEPLDSYKPGRLGGLSDSLARTAAATASLAAQADTKDGGRLGEAPPTAGEFAPTGRPTQDGTPPQAEPSAQLTLFAPQMTPPSAADVPQTSLTVVDEPSTTVAGAGGDLLGGDRFFVRSKDGRLFERRKLAGSWTWRDHGRPDAASRVITSGVAVEPGRVYVRTDTNRLWERGWDGDRWVWRDCGALPGGAASRPTALGGSIHLLGGDGNLHLYDTAARSWRNLGRPAQLAPYEWLYASPRPVSAQEVLVATTGNRLFVCHRPDPYAAASWFLTDSVPSLDGSPSALHLGSRYFYLTPGGSLARQAGYSSVDHGRPLPDRKVVSVGQQSVELFQDGSPGVHVLVTSPTGQLEVAMLGQWDQDLPNGNTVERWGWDQTRWQHPNGLALRRIGPVVGDLHSGQEIFMVTADGRLTSRLGNAWQDHGLPLDPRGSGPWDAPALPRPDLGPGLGLFSSFVTAQLVDPDGQGLSRLRLGAAHDPDLEGRPGRGLSAPTEVLALDHRARALAVAVGHVTGGARPDLVVLTVRQPIPGAPCLAEYRIGRALDENGLPTGGWLGPYQLPDPFHPDVRGADLTLADLDGDGRPELVFAYGVSGADPEHNRVHYRIGWGLTTDGRPAQGWTDSIPTPWTFVEISGVGVDVVAMGPDRTPHLVVLVDGRDTEGWVCRYGVGRGVNRRGLVTGAWRGPYTMGRLTGPSAATGMAVTDLTGTNAPDLVVYRIADGAGALRIGFDLAVDSAGSGGVARWSESYPLHTVASGAAVLGAGPAVAELRSDLAQLRAQTGANFAKAAAPHQGHLLSVSGAAQRDVQDPVPVADEASRLRARLDPEQAVAARVLAGLQVGGRPLAEVLPATGDSLRRLLAGLAFEVPAYQLLRGLSPEHVAPGLPAVEPETMTALAANAKFIEAFMVGLNHEVSRELLWREFPADPRQTWFRQFWDVRDARSAGGPLTDLPPFEDDAWRNGPLGSHLTSVGAPGEDALILVVRGEVLRRYPATVVTMRRAAWAGETVRDPVGPDLPPIFSGRINPDVLLFGFPLTAPVARGAATRTAGDAGYFFVLREQPTAPRFGLDLPPADWSPAPFRGPHWDDLHWGHVGAGTRHLSPYAPGLGRRPDHSGAGLRLDGAEYGRNAADMARVTLQRPVLIARHASTLLPEPPPAGTSLPENAPAPEASR
jgi:hypothetical protein